MKIRISKENADVAALLAQAPNVYVLAVSTARLLVLLVGLCGVAAAGLAGYWLSAGPDAVQRLIHGEPQAARPPVAIDLPNVIVNLSPNSPSRMMQVGLTLMAAPPDRQRLADLQPQLLNALQDFLRNLDQHDLQGSAGLYRLRVELRRRFNLIAGREAVTDVLLRSLLTQ